MYPHLFESQHLDLRSAILVDGGPGTIIHNNERYLCVSDGTPYGQNNSKKQFDEAVNTVRNLCEPPDMKIDWQVRNSLHSVPLITFLLLERNRWP